jgi:hypothetical protein
MKAYVIAAVLFIILFEGQAQKSPIKFGEIPIEDMQMNSYKEDSSASAVVLVDYGVAYISYSSVSISLSFDRHVRIKILKKDGLKWADSKIFTYHQGSTEERVSNLKGSTYNLESGKIVETKLSKEGIFKEKFNDNLNIQKFTLPNVKEGSVIEYTYRINSEFITRFPNWEFQKEIPVVHSEYWAIIPEFFIFEKYMQGYEVLKTFEVKPKSGATFNESAFHYVMKNVPAFKPEPYMTCEDDYLSKVNFALSHINLPNRPVQEIMGSWEKLNTELLEDENFGKVISKSGFLKDLVAEITAGITDPGAKVESIHRYIRQNIEWDGTEDKYAGNLKKVLESKKGTAADINLMLASMLEKAGFTVDMVLLSTRDHGFIRENYPMEKQFNYVICALLLDGKTMLLDATEKYLPLTTLPERCLNGVGLVISTERYGWIEITTKTKAKTMISTELTLLNSGELKGNLSFIRHGYDALSMRDKYSSKGEKDYLKDFLGSRTWQVEKTQFENVKEIDKPVKETHELSIDDHTSIVGDLIYINPFVTGQIKENPFKIENRLYPVDFGAQKEQVYFCKLVIPEGYVVDELPTSRVFVLPGNAAKYTYSGTQQGNVISFTSNLQINKSLFTQTEYASLREFYNQVVAKQAEQIVLKKK